MGHTVRVIMSHQSGRDSHATWSGAKGEEQHARRELERKRLLRTPIMTDGDKAFLQEPRLQ